jgi:hypothetical protein
VLIVWLFIAVTVESHVNENGAPIRGVLHAAFFFMLYLHRLIKSLCIHFNISCVICCSWIFTLTMK